MSIENNDPSNNYYEISITGRSIPVIDIMKNSNIYCFEDVSVATNGSNVYVAYCTYYSSSNSELRFAKSIDLANT